MSFFLFFVFLFESGVLCQTNFICYCTAKPKSACGPCEDLSLRPGCCGVATLSYYLMMFDILFIDGKERETISDSRLNWKMVRR